MKGAKDTVFQQKNTINCRGSLLNLESPVVMGIINTTPDSFHASSRNLSLQEAVDQGGTMLDEGATILDIGGQSTRPGAERVSDAEEAERVLPVVEEMARQYPEAFISIDTFYSRVADQAMQVGAHIINDVSAGSIDRKILTLPAEYNAPYILMHMKGVPATMQNQPEYENPIRELIQFFGQKIAELKAAGARDIIIDPGFGFGKTTTHNYDILDRLLELKTLGCPILVGLSRKGMVRKPLGLNADDALNTTTAAHTIALLNGAKILRAHDVKEAKEAIEITQLLPTLKHDRSDA